MCVTIVTTLYYYLLERMLEKLRVNGGRKIALGASEAAVQTVVSLIVPMDSERVRKSETAQIIMIIIYKLESKRLDPFRVKVILCREKRRRQAKLL